MAAKSLTLSVADAKRRFSELLGRVAFSGDTVTITKRGRAMAKLVPLESKKPMRWADMGILDNDDPFFKIIDEIVENRSQHRLRDPFRPKRRRK